MSEEEVKVIEEEVEDLRISLQNFLDTFKDSNNKLKYKEKIKEMILYNKRSLVIDFEDLLKYDSAIAEKLIREPDEVLQAFSDAIRNIVRIEDPEYAENIEKFTARIRNLSKKVRIRDIRSEHIGKLISVDGILVKATPPKQVIYKAIYRHIHPRCNQEFIWPLEGEIRDVLEKPPYCPYCYPKGISGGTFRLILEKSKFRDWQKITVQERPEELPSGQVPRSIDAILLDDLVDVARPGDRITITGILRLYTNKLGKKLPRPVFDYYIDVNYIEMSQRVLEEVQIAPEDELKIKELARDPLIRRKIVASIAPTIYGLWHIKEAIALLLFGGNPKVTPDGTRIRGDIHILLIGDPGVAKSQLLQFVSRIAPRAVFTTGKGSTAAGLTAAVIRDKTTGEFTLEAGALVLADGGIACIDEIDKMREEDRVAIHEAMEQQVVSIAKAGIVARLNARTSILAAGNPKYGRYLPNRPVSDNINLPPTILSRFDLIFTIRDIPDIERDKQLALYVTEVHRVSEGVKPPIEPDLLRKYIAYARKYVRPKLTKEAEDMIKDFFVEMRKKSAVSPEAPITITARQLEALIRLAEAHAKMALKDQVTEEDAAAAIQLMKYMLESVGIDVETGAIDIDVIMTGKPKTQREKLATIEDIIKELEGESEIGCAKVKEIVRRAKERGIDETFVEKAITLLRREGSIYEVRPGCYARVK